MRFIPSESRFVYRQLDENRGIILDMHRTYFVCIHGISSAKIDHCRFNCVCTKLIKKIVKYPLIRLCRGLNS